LPSDPFVAWRNPNSTLRNAAVYSNFLNNIEPSEHPYHAADVPFWLAEARKLTG